MPRDDIENGLDREHALRAAIAAKRGVRHRVGLAGQAAETQHRQPVAIVGMAERARQHRRRVVGDMAAIGGEQEIEAPDRAVVVEADVVAEIERMPLAGGAHVVVARQTQLHRLARLPGEQRGDAGDDGRLAFLAAEAAAHAAHFDRHRVERNAEHMGDAVLHFGRMLGGGEDMEVAAFARRGDGDLAFEIEVILAAAVKFALQPMSARISARRRYRRAPSSGPARRRLSFATASSTVSTAGSISYSTFTSFAAARA